MDESGVKILGPEPPTTLPVAPLPTPPPEQIKPPIVLPPQPTVAPPPAPLPAPQIMTPTGPQETISTPKRPAIRTMVGDTEQTLKSGDVSAIRLFSGRNDARRFSDEAPSRHVGAWIAAGAIAVVLIAASVFWFFGVMSPSATPALTPPKPAIPATETSVIQLTGPDRKSFLSEWQSAFNQKLLTNEFRAVALFNKNSNAFFAPRDLFQMLRIAPPPLLAVGLRSSLTLGVIGAERGPETLMILSVRSFSEALAGMLAWENNLPQALAEILSQTIALERGVRAFEDILVSNHDARIAKNVAGDPTLVYAIFNEHTLIIAQSPGALELALRQLSFFPPQ